jgi:hypothetical protein
MAGPLKPFLAGAIDNVRLVLDLVKKDVQATSLLAWGARSGVRLFCTSIRVAST